jgi:hypothetical protein
MAMTRQPLIGFTNKIQICDHDQNPFYNCAQRAAKAFLRK